MNENHSLCLPDFITHQELNRWTSEVWHLNLCAYFFELFWDLFLSFPYCPVWYQHHMKSVSEQSYQALNLIIHPWHCTLSAASFITKCSCANYGQSYMCTYFDYWLLLLRMKNMAISWQQTFLIGHELLALCFHVNALTETLYWLHN